MLQSTYRERLKYISLDLPSRKFFSNRVLQSISLILVPLLLFIQCSILTGPSQPITPSELSSTELLKIQESVKSSIMSVDFSQAEESPVAKMTKNSAVSSILNQAEESSVNVEVDIEYIVPIVGSDQYAGYVRYLAIINEEGNPDGLVMGGLSLIRVTENSEYVENSLVISWFRKSVEIYFQQIFKESFPLLISCFT